jgi:NADP-dependent aldehyde dehydrogenase
MSALIGTSLIGFERGRSNGDSFRGVAAASGVSLEPDYHVASEAEVNQAVTLAQQAFESFGRSAPSVRARLLNTIAENIERLADDLVERATQETGLPEPRIRGETARTCFQLRMFAELSSEGSWVDARIERADPNRQPLRKPDVRSMLTPLGPVVVFCASNFPLAFSVAGGDTASALATGNPVIVKAHRAHPGTAEIVGSAVLSAVKSCGLHPGVFSLLYGKGEEIGMQLVRHSLVKAGGFTGSRAGGLALMHAAAARPEPIPFYAEMSSVNPVFVLPAALGEREEEIANGLHGSVTLGAGQFCTNPGLVFLPENSEGLIDRLREKMGSTSPFVMLTSRIQEAYCEGASAWAKNVAVQTLVRPADSESAARAGLYLTDVTSFLTDPSLASEVFGPATLLVAYSGFEQLLEVARSLEGQLTATIHLGDSEEEQAAQLSQVLENRVGRLVYNGFPTGVEVGPAMVHGGPFPATSDGRSTSVGTRAAFRFVRAVCFQDAPQGLLPDELKDGNPLGIARMVDGKMDFDF